MEHYVILSGGLGNQMFQYAFYKSMLYHGIKCSLNTDLYSVVKMHNGCELFKVFGIEELPKGNSFSVLLTRFFYKYQNNPFVYKERGIVYDDKVFKSHAIYFVGTWINELYFKNIEKQIRDSFIFKNIDNNNLCLSQVMNSQNSVSIHFRRGDYLKIPNWNICDKDYYTRAINYIKLKIFDPFFYVFSDDPEWSDSFLKEFNVNYTIIRHNRGENSYKDLFLMSHCKHNINANSTFSWWGAWLNKNNNKIVVAPTLWTRDSNDNPACSDWVKL